MDEHRESCRRQHRVFGHFLAVQAWLRGLDCLVLSRRDLEVFLGLVRFKEQRVNWLQEDLNPWFPHQYVYQRNDVDSFSLHSVLVSRAPFERWLPTQEMTTEELVARWPKRAPRCGAFFEGQSTGRLREEDVVRYLAILDSGLANPEPLLSVSRDL